MRAKAKWLGQEVLWPNLGVTWHNKLDYIVTKYSREWLLETAAICEKASGEIAGGRAHEIAACLRRAGETPAIIDGRNRTAHDAGPAAGIDSCCSLPGES